MRPWRTTLAALALLTAAGYGQVVDAGGNTIQYEVPALVNTYRADPTFATGITTGSVSLSARAVRELYYESYISGFMQGEPSDAVRMPGQSRGNGGYGIPAAPADYGLATPTNLQPVEAYPVLARTQRPEARLPRMPITRSPGPDNQWGTADDQLLLHIRIDKLPSRATCQAVVDHMMRLGLLPGNPDDGIDPNDATDPDAIATGRWRVIIHPPHTKGAPPAPSLYYPEARQALRPDTAAADLETVMDGPPDEDDEVYSDFWDGVRCRWRQWDEYVREVYENVADPDEADADPAFGMEPMPFFLPYPRYLDKTTGIDHTVSSTRSLTTATPEPGFQLDVTDRYHNLWFDPARMDENRLLDPVQEAPDAGAGSRMEERDLLPVVHTDTAANEPLEFVFNFDGDNADDPHQDAATGRLTGWWLKGVHTTGPSESSNSAEAEYQNYLGNVDADVAGTPVGTNTAFIVADNPLAVTINLLTGQWWDSGAVTGTAGWQGAVRPQPLVPGVGMVELQFEYETSCAGDDSIDTDWRAAGPTGDPWQPGGYDGPNAPGDATADPRGVDLTGGTADDIPIEPEYVNYGVGGMVDARGADNDAATPADNPPRLRDPLNEMPGDDGADANTPPWRIRRFSGWPFHPAVIGLPESYPNAPSYQGGPIVCRFLISAILPVPEDEVSEAAYSPVLGNLAAYDPAAATMRFYPQLNALPFNAGAAAGPTFTDYLERASYLLGYRADIALANVGNNAAGPGQDYFFPASPGSATEAHRFFLQSTASFEAGGTVQAWDEPNAGSSLRLRGPAEIRETDQTDPTPGNRPDPLGLDAQVRFAYELTDTGADVTLPTDHVEKMLHCYALQATVNGNTWNAGNAPAGWPGTATMDRGDKPSLDSQDLGDADITRAFDGDTAATTPANPLDAPEVVVPVNQAVGKELDTASVIDRIEIYWHHPTGDTDTPDSGEWAIELAGSQIVEDDRELADRAVPDWTAATTATLTIPTVVSGGQGFAYLAAPSSAEVFGVRLRNTYTDDLILDELRLVTRADVRRSVTARMTAPTPSSDADIVPTPIPDNAVVLSTIADRDVTPYGDNYVEATVKVDVPLRQRPSRDAVERQILADRGSPPGSHVTLNQPRPVRESYTGVWDRYRGEVTLYLDDSKAFSRNPTDANAISGGAELSTTLRPSHWDVKMFMVDNRAAGAAPTNENIDRPALYQFNTWYEEDSGWIGQDDGSPAGMFPTSAGQTVRSARLAHLPVTEQRVSIEPYATFDLETSVAYQRKLAIKEKLLDFGQVLHGGISQWVPVTLINEGNVPLRQVKLYIEQALTPVEFLDRASAARLAQTQPVPAWFAQNLAIQAPTEEGTAEAAGSLSDIDPAPVGSTVGRSVTDVYLRIGRLHPTTPTDDRRIPVGQPIGNYTGRVRAFVDDLGTAGADAPTAIAGDLNNMPDGAAETGLAGAATMKLTIKESPLWRIDDFVDNEVDRRRTRNQDLLPFDQTTGFGSYQPVPEFIPNTAYPYTPSGAAPIPGLYSNPFAAEATPTITVVQDPADFGGGSPPDPPNAQDALWVGFSRRTDQGGGASNWGVFYRDAARPAFLTGTQILQTNYRAFRWPANLPEVQVSTAAAGQRNLYPNLCPIPRNSGDPAQYLLLWHNEQDDATRNRRATAIQFLRFEGTNSSGVLQIPDDASGQGLVNKQVPRAFVDDLLGQKILWCTWQSGETGQNRLGFNAIAMPSSYNGAASAYVDAIQAKGQTFVNYSLQTPPGLTNVMSPYPLPSYRNSVTNIPGISGELQTVNLLYSAFSPLWQNQDIYWSRYRPLEDPALSGTDPIATLADGLKYSPMAEDAYRLAQLPIAHPTTGNPAYWVRSLPGGRLPFPRITNELLKTNANHTIYAAGSIDWVMPPDQPRVSGETPAGGWSVEKFNHRGFADADRPLFDQDRYDTLAAGTADPNLDPLVILRVQQAATPSANPGNDPTVQRVVFDLDRAYWDASANEWVLPITGPNFLLNEGVTVTRVHPGLGRVTFNKALYRRGSQTPIYVFATYRPCAWRVTTSRAADDQPAAAFDWWERMLIVWKRTVEGGKGELWYRTFSLSVPLSQAPATQLRAVVNDDDAATDQAFNGSATAPVSRWSFTGMVGGFTQQGDGAWSGLNQNPTSQGFTLTQFDNRVAVTTNTAQGNAQVGWNAAAMVHFGYNDIGRRIRLWYDTPLTATPTPVEEAVRVVGLGPERRMPLSGDANESQPAVAPEHFYVGYQRNGTTERIMSTRFWLAWVSTRDLYVPDPNDPAANPPRLGTAGTNLFYGAFLPNYASDNLGD